MREQNKQTVQLKVFRFNPATDEEPRYETYTIPISEKISIMNALQYVLENYDPGLSFYISCRYGICTGCLVKVNGKNRFACLEPLTADSVVEPVNKNRVVKDLVVKAQKEGAQK